MTADSKELRERSAIDIRSTTTREEINRLTTMGFHTHLMWKEDITALLSTNEALARENGRRGDALRKIASNMFEAGAVSFENELRRRQDIARLALEPSHDQ